MSKKETSNKLAIFEGNEIRRVLLDNEWYYSIEDVVRVLTDSRDPKQYIQKLKQRDSELNAGWVQFVHTLPIKTNGGTQKINCANTEGLFRIIQSIPSKKAEPFKRWLAKVGKERIDEIEQPGKAIERARNYYLAKGYPTEWVQTRIAGIETRHTFTDTLKGGGVRESYQYAILTNEMYQSWSTFDAKGYKQFKGLEPSDSLRDNMTPMELATTIFNETAARELIEKSGAKGFQQTRHQIHIAGNITKEAIEKIEKQTGKKVVTHKNMKELNSPKVQKQIAQQSMKEEEDKEELSDFDKQLKGLLSVSPEKKTKQ